MEELEEECTVATIAAVVDCEAMWKKCVTVVKTVKCMERGSLKTPMKDTCQCSSSKLSSNSSNRGQEQRSNTN